MNKDILMVAHNNTHSTSRIFRNIELIRRTEISDEVNTRLSRIETACQECREQVDTLYEISKGLYTEEQVIKLISDMSIELNANPPESFHKIQSCGLKLLLLLKQSKQN
jgi:hypothetical protein